MPVTPEQLARDRARVEAEISGADGGIDPFVAAVHATRMPMVITDPRQDDNPIIFVNDSFCRLTGYDRAEIVGRNCRFLQGPETDAADVARIRAAIDARREIEIDIRNHRKDGTPFWNRLLMAPVYDAGGELAYFFASQLDVTVERDRLRILEGENAQLTAERGAREQRLLFSEESLRLAIEAAEIGTWDLDLTTDALTWSDRTKAMFGISPGAPCSMADFYEGLHPEDREATTATFASALDPQRRSTYDVEYRTIGKEDGIVRWVAAKGRGLFDESGRCIRAIGTAIDITKRRATEERLRQSEAELRELNATLEARVAERTAERDRLWRSSLDIQVAIDRSGRFVSVNPAATTILGWQPEEMVGRQIFDFILPEDADIATDALAYASHDSLPVTEVRYRHRDGGFRWLSWVAAPEGDLIFASGRHITAEKERDAAFAQSQARLRTLFETSYQLQGLLALDGTLIDANATALSVIECGLDEVVGQPFWDTPWFAGTPGMAERIREGVSIAARGEVWRHGLTVDVTKGRRSYDFSIRPIHDSQGMVIAIVPEAVDITEHRIAEEALRQAQKMEAVGQLTGGIAHDFNNLLAGISGSLELTQRRLAEGRTGDVDRYLVAAQGAAKRAAALTHRLLAFSRRQTLDPKPTDVNRLIAGMEELIRRSVGPSIAIDVAGASGVWATLVDPPQLENALLNLCINARDAMPDGGRMTIETANVVLDDREARERDMQPGPYVTLSVTDTGTGMTPEVMAKVFDPFFTTKPIGQGTGLGLSMIYGFVRQSGGQVRIASQVGSGTRICLYLPRHEGIAGEAEASDASRGSAPVEKGRTVLVVDDEPTVRMLLTDVLEELGYVTIEAHDAASGLKVLRSDAHLDLLVTDVGLPGGMNGRQLADAARVDRPALKVLFITGYAETAALGEGSLMTGMHVLTKPFVMETLAERIADLLEAG